MNKVVHSVLTYRLVGRVAGEASDNPILRDPAYIPLEIPRRTPHVEPIPVWHTMPTP
jgi:hypothetical protein